MIRIHQTSLTFKREGCDIGVVCVYMSQDLEEESQDLSSEMLPPGLLVVHDAPGGGQHNVAELSGGQEVVGPLLDVSDGDIEPGGDHTALVEAPSQIDNNFASSVVINDLKLPDVAVLHHNGEEPEDHLGAG